MVRDDGKKQETLVLRYSPSGILDTPTVLMR